MVFMGIWLLLILVASVMPASGPKTELPADKLVHVFMYGLTSIVLFRFIAQKTTVRRAFFMAVAIASLYGMAMEVAQYFVPYRSFSFGDMAANAAGAFLGCLLYVKWKPQCSSSR